MSLTTKLIVAISIVLLLVLAPFSYLHIRSMKALLFQEAVTAADNISETIIKTTHYQMLENDRKRVYQMIDEAGKQQGIEHIRMITKDGMIIFSTEREEIGAFLNKSASACDMCHAGDRPLTQASSMSRSRVFKWAGDEEVLGMTKAIYNQESCYTASCHFHPADQNILGVLDTTVSLERLRDQTAQYTRRLVLLTLVVLFMIAVALSLLVRKLVIRPIHQILRHTQKVGELEFNTKVEVATHDEIADLADSFNDMTKNLKASKEQLEDAARTLESRVERRTAELKHMQNQLIRSEKLASLGEIVAGIAHELNNPLTGILVMSSLIQKDQNLEPSFREDIDTIVHESKRCAGIVKGLLDFSRESIPQKNLSSINQIMEHTLALIGNQSIFHNVEIIKRFGESLPDLMVDPNQIEQVFINLLLNAAQAMAQGGSLTIETAASDSSICVRISDTGCGIRPEDLRRIFDPFFTTKQKGTGLGLSVSYGIVQNHGGAIEVESEVGVGTTFLVRLPAAGHCAEGEEAPKAAA